MRFVLVLSSVVAATALGCSDGASTTDPAAPSTPSASVPAPSASAPAPSAPPVPTPAPLPPSPVPVGPSDASSWFRRTGCTSAPATARRVYTSADEPGQLRPTVKGLLATATHLYYTQDVASPRGSMSLVRVALADGTRSHVASNTLGAFGVTSAGGIVDHTPLADPSTHGLRLAEGSGGLPSSLPTGRLYGVFVNQVGVGLLSGGVAGDPSVIRVSVGGVERELVRFEKSHSSGLVTDGREVFFMTKDPAVPGASFEALAIGGGVSPRVVHRFASAPTLAGVDDRELYFLRPVAGDLTELAAVTKDGVTVRVLTAQKSFFGLSIGPTHVTWLEGGDIVRMPRLGGALERFSAPNGRAITALAVDECNYYFATDAPPEIFAQAIP